MPMRIILTIIFTVLYQGLIFSQVNLESTISLAQDVLIQPSLTSPVVCNHLQSSSETEIWTNAGYENVEIKQLELNPQHYMSDEKEYLPLTHRFELDVVNVRESGWSEEVLIERYNRVSEVFKRCGILLDEIRLITVDGPRDIVDLNRINKTLNTEAPNLAEINVTEFNPGEVNTESDYRFGERMPNNGRLTNIHINDVLGNPSISSPEFIFGEDHPLLNKQWIESRVLDQVYRRKRNPHICTEAHELGHVLLNQGHLTSDEENIMNGNGELRNDQFSPEQCSTMKTHKLVTPINQ